jgi:hypothetical protein
VSDLASTTTRLGEQFASRFGAGIRFPLLQHVGFGICKFGKMLHFIVNLSEWKYLQAACKCWKGVFVVAAALSVNHRLFTVGVSIEMTVGSRWEEGEVGMSPGCSAEGGQSLAA